MLWPLPAPGEFRLLERAEFLRWPGMRSQAIAIVRRFCMLCNPCSPDSECFYCFLAGSDSLDNASQISSV